MDASLTALRVQPLLAVAQSGDNTRLVLTLIAIGILVVCAGCFAWQTFGPYRPPKGDPPLGGTLDPGPSSHLIIMIVAAFAMFLLFILQMSDANPCFYGAP